MASLITNRNKFLSELINNILPGAENKQSSYLKNTMKKNK